MKTILIVAACLVVLAAAKSDKWESYKKRFGKTYKSATEEYFRKKIFLDNLDKIYKHNDLYKQGKVTYTLGVNQFADLTNAEFAERNTYIPRSSTYKSKNTFKVSDAKAVPDSIDWRDSGYVTRVKNQGQCGSCWSFSTTGSLEGQHFAATGNLVELSEQNLMDCSYSYGNLACQGGQMDAAFQYIIANNGIDTEASYPYEERDSTNCRYSLANRGATMSDYVDVTKFDENALKQACGTVGPISVAIDASKMSFQLYNGGVYYEPSCSSISLDHGVLVVGYGTETLEDYWLVKNSWGITWGEQGYIKMSRNRDNNCGIATEPSYPVV